MVNDAVGFRVLLRCAAKAYLMRLCEMRTIVVFFCWHIRALVVQKEGVDGTFSLRNTHATCAFVAENEQSVSSDNYFIQSKTQYGMANTHQPTAKRIPSQLPRLKSVRLG